MPWEKLSARSIKYLARFSLPLASNYLELSVSVASSGALSSSSRLESHRYIFLIKHRSVPEKPLETIISSPRVRHDDPRVRVAMLFMALDTSQTPDKSSLYSSFIPLVKITDCRCPLSSRQPLIERAKQICYTALPCRTSTSSGSGSVATVDAQEAINSRIERGVSLLIILISADYMNISPCEPLNGYSNP